MISITTFNANNFFLRYKFSKNLPNSKSKDSLIEAGEVIGYLPGIAFGKYTKNFIVWDSKRRNLASEALKAPDDKFPDIICFQEVENIEAIRILNQRYFNNEYQYSMLIDSYDPRNIDVGILSKFPINSMKSHIDDFNDAGDRIFSRDCLEVELQIKNEPLYLFLNHFKSKLVKRDKDDTDEKYKNKLLKSHTRRLNQAAEVAKIIKEKFKGSYNTALFAVIGDFNDTPFSPWLKPLMDSPHLIDVISRHLPYESRWTYYWKSRSRVSQIDYFLVSKELNKRIEKAIEVDDSFTPYIERRGIGFRKMNAAGDNTLPAEVNYMAYETDEVTAENDDAPATQKQTFRFPRFEEVLANPKNNISDHCPVKIWFKQN
ncbi:endonuclease/exonuclease/phosphatase family protein [Croceitalea marina]|uniref:Endonuclease/exonuclease/phosphatase family protein n=1 Tax=Croceitalea marina TaxID=1775166 RepID=A0ABW5N0J2_9FLAO